MWQWLRELREIINEPEVCPVCEVLKVELSNVRREKDMLLQRVITPSTIEMITPAPEPIPVMPRHKPWRVKQQELEREDRIQADRMMEEFKAKVASAEKVMGVE